MRNIRIGVVEDDPASCQLVLDYLNRYQSETGEQFTVSVFDDGARIVEKYAPVYDILLLDIEMKEMDGMAAARRIRERDDNVVIIFITAAPQYAISGYEVRALSYLLKPLPWFAFSQELKKSIDMVRRNGDDSMLIETGNGQMRMNLADILYLESIRHTIVIHTLDGKYSINGTLKDMEAKLADRHFFRSNSCYLVNLKHVTGVADQDCIMSDDERLRVSRPRKKAFLAALADSLQHLRPSAGGDDADHQRAARHPRSYSAICEWAACMVYIAVLFRRVPPQRSVVVSAIGLAALIAVQYFDGSMPIWFWIVGMLLAFGCMYLTILFGAGTGKREGLYITARAFVLAELVASLHWQIVTFIGMRDGFADYDWHAIVLLLVTPTHCVSAWLGWLNAAISARPRRLCRPLLPRLRRWPS